MDLYLRRVIHPQAHDNYRVILKCDDGEFEIGSIDIQHDGGWRWRIDAVMPMRATSTVEGSTSGADSQSLPKDVYLKGLLAFQHAQRLRILPADKRAIALRQPSCRTGQIGGPIKSGWLGIFCIPPVFLLAAIKSIASMAMVKAHVGALANTLDVTLQVTVLVRTIVFKGSAEMKHVLASLTFSACLLLPSAGAVFGQTTGQPGTSAGVNCGGAGPASSGLPTPGHAASSPGAPFNEPAPVGIGSGGKAGAKYAGSGANTGTPANSVAVSQYDVACLHQLQVP